MGTQIFSDASRLNCHGDILVMDAEIEAHDIATSVCQIREGLEATVQITAGICLYAEANTCQDGESMETGTGLI